MRSVIILAVSACGTNGPSLHSLPGSTDPGGTGPVFLGIDGENNPMIARSDDSALGWTGSTWKHSEWLGGASCRFRDSYAEGNIGLDRYGRTWRWQHGEYVQIGSVSTEGCDTLSASAASGEAFKLAPTDATGEHSELYRASGPGAAWVKAFTEVVDLGPPSSIHADSERGVWVLGRSGIAHVSPDGRQLERIRTGYTTMVDGVVDYSQAFLFTAAGDGDSMYWVTGSGSVLHLFRSPARTCMTSRAVAPDQIAWAIWADGDCGPDASFALYKRKVEDADVSGSDWEHVLDLDEHAGRAHDNWTVAASRLGRVFLVQGGAGGAGVFVLESAETR